MELRQLTYFLAAAQTENFGRAAELCMVAQSNLSRQIAALEAELKVELFKRVKKRVILTSAGHEFTIYARGALEQLQLGQQIMAKLETGEQGTISIGCVEPLATAFLPDILARFHQNYPNINFKVKVGRTDDLLKLVEQATVDLGLVFDPTTRPELLVVKELFRQPLQLLTSLQHPFANSPNPVSLEQVAKEPLILRGETSRLRKIVEGVYRQRGHSLQTIIEIDSLEGLKELVKQGVGVSIMPSVIVRQSQIKTELAVLPISDFMEEYIFALVYRRFGTIPVAARGLINTVLDLRKL